MNSGALPNVIRRYSRLPVCATARWPRLAIHFYYTTLVVKLYSKLAHLVVTTALILTFSPVEKGQRLHAPLYAIVRRANPVAGAFWFRGSMRELAGGKSHPDPLPTLLSQNADRETRSQRFPESCHRPLQAADKDRVKMQPHQAISNQYQTKMVWSRPGPTDAIYRFAFVNSAMAITYSRALTGNCLNVLALSVGEHQPSNST